MELVTNPMFILPAVLVTCIVIEGIASVVACCRRKDKQCNKKEKCPMSADHAVPPVPKPSAITTLRSGLNKIKKAIEDYGVYTTDDTLISITLPPQLEAIKQITNSLLCDVGIDDLSYLLECVADWNKMVPPTIIPVYVEQSAQNTVHFKERLQSLVTSYGDQEKYLQESLAVVQEKTDIIKKLSEENDRLTSQMKVLAADNGNLHISISELEHARWSYDQLRQEIPSSLQCTENGCSDPIAFSWYNLRRSVHQLIAAYKTKEVRIQQLEEEKEGLEQQVTDNEALANKRAQELAVADTKIGSLEVCLQQERDSKHTFADNAWISGFNSLYSQVPAEMQGPCTCGSSPVLKIWDGICQSMHNLLKFYKKHKDSQADDKWESAFHIMLRGIPQPILTKAAVKAVDGDTAAMSRWRELVGVILALKHHYNQTAQLPALPVVKLDQNVPSKDAVDFQIKLDPLEVAEKQCRNIFEDKTYGMSSAHDKDLSCAVQNVITYLRQLEKHQALPGQLYTGVFGFDSCFKTNSGKGYRFGFTTMQQANSFCAGIRFLNPPKLHLRRVVEGESGRMFYVDVIDTTKKE